MDSSFDTYLILNKNNLVKEYSLRIWHKWHDDHNVALVAFINLRVIEWKALEIRKIERR